MATGRRAYDLLRGYVNTEWDRIHQVDDRDDPAAKELAEALQKPTPRTTAAKPEEAAAVTVAPEDRAALARKILGVEPEAQFAEICHIYERINKRAAPSNFPEGSPEANQAAQIQKRVQWAFDVLKEGADVTEIRFRSLEIE